MRKLLLVLLVGCCACVVESTEEGPPGKGAQVVLVESDAGEPDANECTADAEPANVDQDAQAMQSPCFVP
jgi:hypothetical protein